MPALSIGKTAVMEALGISRRTRYEILHERQLVTVDVAVRLEKLFGNGTGFWVNLPRIYDLAVVERTIDVSGMPTLQARTA